MPYFELYKSDDLQAPVSLPQIVTMDYEAVLELGYALSSAQHTGNVTACFVCSKMVQYRLASPGSSSQTSEESAQEIGIYQLAEHDFTYGIPDKLVASSSFAIDSNGVDWTLSFPITPHRPVGTELRSHLVQTPLPKPPPPGSWPQTPQVSAPPTSPSGSLILNRPTPRPPGAFPPTTPYANRIAPAQDSPNVTESFVPGSVLPSQSTWLAKRRQYKPNGKSYKSTGSKVVMAPVGVPTSPQKNGIERSWVTWYHDGSTRNFIPAVATEIVGKAEAVDWDGVMYLLQTTNHPHIIRLLDGSHLPKRDPLTGQFVRYPPGPEGNFVEKSATDLGNLAGWDEKQWKEQRRRWRDGRFSTDLKVLPGFFPHPFLVWERMDGRQLGVTLTKRPDGVEEEFVWYFLVSLLDAVRWLHHGLPERLRPEDDWRPVVHNNINPDTIWLNRPWKRELRYGTIKLGDFSRAIVLDPISTNSLNSSVRDERFQSVSHKKHAQQEDFEAPELSWLLDTDPEKDASNVGVQSSTSCHPLGGKSDIWSIGAVAVALMGGIWIDPGDSTLLRWSSITRERAFVLQTLQLYKLGGKRWDITLLPQNYSRTLRAVLERLLTLDPKRRPDAIEALSLARKGYEKWSTEHVPSQHEDNTEDGIESDNGAGNDGDDESAGSPLRRSPVDHFKVTQAIKRPSSGFRRAGVEDVDDGEDSSENSRPAKKRKPSEPQTPSEQRPNALAQSPPLQQNGITSPSHAATSSAGQGTGSRNGPRTLLKPSRRAATPHPGQKKSVSFNPRPQYGPQALQRESTLSPGLSPISNTSDTILQSSNVQKPAQKGSGLVRQPTYDRTHNSFGVTKRRSSALAPRPAGVSNHSGSSVLSPRNVTSKPLRKEQVTAPRGLPKNQTWKATDRIEFAAPWSAQGPTVRPRRPSSSPRQAQLDAESVDSSGAEELPKSWCVVL
ncbi:hypothetical protein CKM354_000333700 [Cercospora kikuchii]|uniref:non-specific serine/threonine protein kinase n=1 Tax=Cercospora kikuchii TaxID=84275 RepID=A0A9P3FAG1_9PEZI|nr:uncharacterized protein CKM354_000333700 [Cercospora kikuchii]GIZ39978.1 hypothetical protein CKM354_000333700 [Cercospora kikuchii]